MAVCIGNRAPAGGGEHTHCFQRVIARTVVYIPHYFIHGLAPGGGAGKKEKGSSQEQDMGIAQQQNG